MGQVRTRETLATAAAVAAFLAASWVLAILLSGGIRLTIGPILISSRTPVRAALVAIALSVLAAMLAPAGGRLAVWEGLRQQIEKKSPIAVVIAAGAVLWLTLAYGARAAGGADTLGYVSSAYLWLNGNLVVPQPLAPEMPWPYADDSLTPLGYRLGPLPHTMVPTYSPGLPLIMAGLHLLVGECGPYLVQPLFGSLLVLLTFGLGYRLTRDRLTSALAALFMASSPTLLFNLMTPMSDTATAALWIGSLLLLTCPGVVPAALAGLVAGLAILVRPNLVPLALAGVVAAELWPADHVALKTRRGIRSVAFLAGVVPAALCVAFLNDKLYGSPLLSGYGRAATLYGAEWFSGNLQRYASWLLTSQSPFILVALLPLLVRRLRPAWLTRSHVLPIAVAVLIVCASYLFYMQFREWWFLRFMLTVFPFLFILLAVPIARLFRAAPSFVAVPTLMLIVSLALRYWLGFTVGLGTLSIGEGEERYAAVARYIERELPPTAIILSMQHSGTIRFYSGRLTLRYEYVAPHRFKSTLDWLIAKGYRPYILLENWEESRWRQHYATNRSVAGLDFRIIAELEWPAGIRLFDPLAPAGSRELVRQIPVSEDRSCHPPSGAWGK
jgi:hypothetical protein